MAPKDAKKALRTRSVEALKRKDRRRAEKAIYQAGSDGRYGTGSYPKYTRRKPWFFRPVPGPRADDQKNGARARANSFKSNPHCPPTPQISPRRWDLAIMVCARGKLERSLRSTLKPSPPGIPWGFSPSPFLYFSNARLATTICRIAGAALKRARASLRNWTPPSKR